MDTYYNWLYLVENSSLTVHSVQEQTILRECKIAGTGYWIAGTGLRVRIMVSLGLVETSQCQSQGQCWCQNQAQPVPAILHSCRIVHPGGSWSKQYEGTDVLDFKLLISYRSIAIYTWLQKPGISLLINVIHGILCL